MHIAMIPGDCIRTSSCMTRKRICLYDARALQMTPQTQHVPAPSVGHSVCLHGHSGFASAQLDFLGIHRSPWSHKGGQSYTAHHGHTRADSHTPLTMVTQRRTNVTLHGHTKADSQTVRDDTRQRRQKGRNVRQGRQQGHATGGSCNTCFSGQGRTPARVTRV